ncbi:MAG: metal ABC transporter substrate-binding protein [Lachnospiraceae bacterium]|nr:metal ABC transporter substrate-binding protein [Lachnospiraceae bacterium]MDY5741469.1 metal ABC transporter substrate-binding protein [Lachnospiraceae bacterium]
MKHLRLLLAGALSFSLLAACTAGSKPSQTSSKTVSVATDKKDNEKLQVYSSFYVMTDFVQKIGGDKVDVKTLVPAGVEPHDWEPEATDMAALEKANVLVYNGAGMEHWVEKVSKTLGNKKLVPVEASKGIELLTGEHHHHDEAEDHEHDKSHDKDEKHEHDHGDTDPHVWLNVKNAKKELENIKDGLVKADAANKTYYEQNYQKWAKLFDDLDQKFTKELAAYKGKSIVTAHEAFGYLCHAYGLKQIGIEGLSPNSEPDPQRMKEVISFVKENKVSTIFFEELVSPKVAESIAKETGAKTAMLNPLESAPEKGDYLVAMEINLTSLLEALAK